MPGAAVVPIKISETVNCVILLEIFFGTVRSFPAWMQRVELYKIQNSDKKGLIHEETVIHWELNTLKNKKKESF